jgi:hypothetical protein
MRRPKHSAPARRKINSPQSTQPAIELLSADRAKGQFLCHQDKLCPSRASEGNPADVITLWSRQFDGSKVDEANGYCKNEVSKLNAGEEKPEDILIEQLRHLELIVNLATARRLAIAIPDEMRPGPTR